MAVHGFDADGVRRIVDVVRASERQPLNRPQQRGRYPIATSSSSKKHRITAKNCCVDARSLAVGATGEVFAREQNQPLNWAIARPCEADGTFTNGEPDPGDTETPFDTILVGFPVSFSGFVTYGTVIETVGAPRPALATDISRFRYAISGGIPSIEAVDTSTGLTAKLYEDLTDYEVDVLYANPRGYTVSDGASLALIWEPWVDPAIPTTYKSRLKLIDFGCPPLSEE